MQCSTHPPHPPLQLGVFPAEFLLGGMKRHENGSPSSDLAWAPLAAGEAGSLAGREGGAEEEEDQSGTGEERPEKRQTHAVLSLFAKIFLALRCSIRP